MTSQRSPGRATLRPEVIIDTALDLTERRGLSGWTIRDIQRELGASMSSIYHHVGGRNELARRVVERVLQGIEVPPDDLPWRDWFTAVLFPLRTRLARYPGVAHWMLMYGPIFPQLMPLLDAATAMLRRAGFTENTGQIYAVIFNTATSAIAMSDDRAQHSDDGPRDHRHIMERLRALSDASPGGHALLEVLGAYTGGAEEADAARDAYYRFLLTTLLNGLDLLRRDPAADVRERTVRPRSGRAPHPGGRARPGAS